MTMKVVFVQTAHKSNDDRVFYHQDPILRQFGYQTAILSTVGAYTSFREERQAIRHFLYEQNADYIICDTPKAVLSAVGCHSMIIYDITEWYPSKKNLRSRGLLMPIVAVMMAGINFLAGCIADAFIFGEEDKRIPFRLFFWKKYIMLPYYPSLRFFEHPVFQAPVQRCRLFYAGPRTKEKGWERVLQVVAICKERRSDIAFELIHLAPEEYLQLPDFCHFIQDVDICLDLRDIDTENTHCLPIKLFYYMAAGKPVVYSRLESIEHQVPEIQECGTLVRSIEEAVASILQYCDDSEGYMTAAQKGHQLFKEKYNWEKIADRLFRLIH